MYTKIAGAAAALVLMAAPAWAAGAPTTTPTGSDNPGTGHHKATPGSHGKAYGRYCRSESKKHIAGEKGTPFSRCVTAMAKLAKNQTDSPRKACKSESKKHVKGQKGTPFSRCVSGGAKLLKDQDAETENESSTPDEQPAS
jgi:hypothetical protein